jgi:acyl-coenzyme A synthetase/AMP-(fatty) acid ligase
VVNPDVRAGDVLASDLQDWVAQRIGAYKRPRWISFLAELPKTATGKVQRFKLREAQAAQGQKRVRVKPSETKT